MENHSDRLTFTPEEFAAVREKAETQYKSFGSVACPYFQGKVNFNAEGLEHIKLKAWNKSRSQRDQFMRLKLIHLAPLILKSSRTLQGIWETKLPIRRKRHGRWEQVYTAVTFYEFIAVIDNRRVKVIVKHLEGGERFFWTLIPFWRVDTFNRRILHSGNPEAD